MIARILELPPVGLFIDSKRQKGPAMRPYPNFIDPIPEGDPPTNKSTWDDDTRQEIPVGDPPSEKTGYQKPEFDRYFIPTCVQGGLVGSTYLRRPILQKRRLSAAGG